MIQNESGQLTTDFMFAIVIAFGLFSLFFSMTYTFSVIEVSQYIAFSTARTHAASNLDKSTQMQEAIKKFNSLKDSKAFASLYSGSWYTFGPLTENLFRQGTSETYANEFSNQPGGTEQFRKVFVGVSIPLEAKVLAFKIPFISSGEDGEDNSIFKTNVNAMLIREVSQEECQTEHWGEKRKSALQRLRSGNQFYVPEKYFRMEDNGC